MPVAAITKRAGVGVGSFYNHFESKDGLFTEAAQSAFMEFEAELTARTAHITGHGLRLCTRVRLFCRTPDSHPTLARILVNAAPRSLVSPTGYSPVFARDVEQAASAGEIGREDLPTRMLVIAAGAERIISQSIVFALPPDQRADDFAAVALELLGMPAEAARELAHLPLDEVLAGG